MRLAKHKRTVRIAFRIRRQGQKEMNHLSVVSPREDHYTVTLIRNSSLDVIKIREESSDPVDRKSEAWIEDSPFSPSDRSTSKDIEGRKKKRKKTPWPRSGDEGPSPQSESDVPIRVHSNSRGMIRKVVLLAMSRCKASTAISPGRLRTRL